MATRSSQSRRPPLKQKPEPHSRAKWTTSLTKILVDSMIEQVHRGNKKKHSFGKNSWKFICNYFYDKTGLKWDKEQLKYRYAVLRKQYVVVKSILDQSDFDWDAQTGAIIAKDEAWDRYIEKHPDAEILRSTGFPIYRELCTIFSEPRRDRAYNGLTEEEGSPSGLSAKNLGTFNEEPSSDSEEEVDLVNEQDNFQSTNPSKDSCRKRGRKGIEDIIANAIKEMAAASKLRTSAIKKCNERYSVSDCIRALDGMQVDQQLYFAALDLFNNRNAREIFLSLKADKRLTWLCGKCLVNS